MSPGLSRSGVVVVDKGAGMTSFDVVALVRRALHARRVGHGGTLDPSATGVLPVLIGEATKLAPYVLDHDKEYVATVRLGITTDTQDTTGRVVSTAPVPRLSSDDIQAACAAFVGRLRQVPPMYSAIHHQGQRLYELARAGVEVEREPREVVVHSIELEETAGTSLTVRVVCGRGTYVRTLAADLGARLGCGGALERLVRTRVGAWTLQEAVATASFGTMSEDEIWRWVLPPESAVMGLPAVSLAAGAAGAFRHGQAVRLRLGNATSSGLVRVRSDDVFLGVGEVVTGPLRVRPVRLLHADRSQPPVLPA